jgi:hypothetical protein
MVSGIATRAETGLAVVGLDTGLFVVTAKAGLVLEACGGGAGSLTLFLDAVVVLATGGSAGAAAAGIAGGSTCLTF